MNSLRNDYDQMNTDEQRLNWLNDQNNALQRESPTQLAMAYASEALDRALDLATTQLKRADSEAGRAQRFAEAYVKLQSRLVPTNRA